MKKKAETLTKAAKQAPPGYYASHRNKVTLFDLMERALRIGAAAVKYGMDGISVQPTLCNKETRSKIFYLRFYHDDEMIAEISTESPESVLAGAVRYLDNLEEEVQQHEQREEKKKAALRKLTPEEREALGFANWDKDDD